MNDSFADRRSRERYSMNIQRKTCALGAIQRDRTTNDECLLLNTPQAPTLQRNTRVSRTFQIRITGRGTTKSLVKSLHRARRMTLRPMSSSLLLHFLSERGSLAISLSRYPSSSRPMEIKALFIFRERYTSVPRTNLRGDAFE